MKSGFFRRLSIFIDLLFLLFWKTILLIFAFILFAAAIPLRIIKKAAKQTGIIAIFQKIPIPNAIADMLHACYLMLIESCMIPLFAALNNSPGARRLFFIVTIPGFLIITDVDFPKSTSGLPRLKSCTASYYDKGFAFKKTANGEIYNPSAMTAAHRILPFNTILLVRNRKNGREAVIRINDRGPFVKGRDIDLSRAAAKKLRMMESGLAQVDMWILSR